ncbi:MAG TPA: VOC family protein [Candidatus Angelobacter sp.]|jgi:PhnB protein|nr:VOC family protein [Candidatus Angelobacter sp.]
MAVNYKPADTQDVIPYLVVPDGEKELEFLKATFNAKEMHVSRRPDGAIAHADLKVGDCTLMMGQGNEQWPPLPAGIYVYVRDVDATYKRALSAGATSMMPPADQFYGDRNCGVKDANGVTWWIGTHVEDVPAEELNRRAEEASKKAAQSV